MSAVSVLATMEKETELTPRRIPDLLVQPRNSFSFRRPSLDDDTSVSELSLKEWAPAPVATRQAPASEKEAVVVSNGVLKGSIRTRYLPLDPNDGGNLPHGGVPTKLPSPEIEREDQSATSGALNGGQNGHVPTKLPTEDEVVQSSPSEDGHVINFSPRALPKPVAFDITFDDSVQKKQGRTAPLKVSFIDEVEIGSPNVPAKSPTTQARGNTQKDPPVKSSSRNNPPPWERSTKVGVQSSPVPKKIIIPTSHGLKIKKGVTAIRPRGTNAAPSLQRSRSRREYPTDQGEYQTEQNLVVKSLDSSNYGGWERHSSTVVGKSLDSNFFGGGEYDSTSNLMTKSLLSPMYSDRKEIPESGSRVFVPRNNGGRKSGVEEEEDDDEDVKVAMLCGSLADTNRISGDLGRLFSKFRRPGPQIKTKPSAPLRSAASDPSVANKTIKTGSTASIISKTSLESTMGSQKYSIGSHASMKVLQECCSGEKIDTTSAYSLHKPRKIRDHEPHRHYYKTITMTLEQKLKG